MTEITAARLDDIDQRAMDATHGPWEAYRRPGTVIGEPNTFGVDDGRHSTLIESSSLRAQDAEFIAHARQDVPDLAGALRTVVELHRRDVIECVDTECAQHDCGHDEDCPTTLLLTCAECYRVAVEDPNDPDKVESTVPPDWPCPTAAALGITKES